MTNVFDWPIFALCDNLYLPLTKLAEQHKTFVMATLVDSEHSASRPIGSQMLISEDQEIWGYVSGGCIESNLLELALSAINNHQSSFLVFGTGSPYIDLKLLCGTKIEIALDVIKPDNQALLKLLKNYQARKPALWVGRIDNYSHFCFDSVDEPKLPHEIKEAVKVKTTGKLNSYYWKYFTPNLRLIINGNNPVAMALIGLAAQMGWEVILNCEHGSNKPAEINLDYYCRLSGKKLFQKFALDHKTAVISLTHNLEADHEIIKYALPSNAFYVGVLGSRKHLPKREHLLKQDGIQEADFMKLKAPIGLEIGSATANEIAIAIIGDLIKTFRNT